MALIPDDALESIRSRVDIAELVKDYVPQLSRAGRSFKARCPFHQERTPSFIVTPERGTFHCFGCGAGGDVFAFLMKMESLSFTEAAEKLAERAGVKIVKKEEALGPAEQERLKIRELLELAATFYHQALLQSAAAAGARKYLDERKVSAESLSAFRLGYAAKDGDVAARALRKGFAPELVVKAGLARQTERGLRDYFFDRILYPIQDAKGAVVGFGARALGEAMPKYLNSPESPVFSQGRVLYGLFPGLPEVRKGRRVVLMEGYMDVMAAHQHGLKTACAPLGTALTLDQIALVKRYASEATVVFDADRAGESAALRSAELLLASGLGVGIATVPQGKDPDEFLHAHGLPDFQKCLAGAMDLAQFQTELALKRRSAPLGPAEKAAVAREVLETVSRCPDEVLKDEWLRRLAQRLGIDEASLRRQLGKHAEARPQRPAAASAAARPGALAGGEEDLFLQVFMQPRLFASLRESDLSSEAGRRLWLALSQLPSPWPADWPARLREALAPEDNALAQRMLLKADELDGTDAEGRLAEMLARRRAQARYDELRGAMARDGRLGKAELDEYLKLTAALKGSPKK
ncbi:MAG: DNA primase [Elusimicrobia bacterium]|nr:DNA primase [Elusimicrobiota bacterium]